MNGQRVIFRCDASPVIGVGHVGRCLSLADAFLAEGYRVVFAVRPGTRETVPPLAEMPVDVIELKGPVAEEALELTAAMDGCDCLVVDHYERSQPFETACRGWARLIIALDDQTGRRHDCDVLSDAGAPSPTVYCGLAPESTRVLTGPDYALVRRSFIARRDRALARRDGRPLRNVLVTFGATDPTNMIPKVLDALRSDAGECRIVVAMSGQSSHLDAVRARVRDRVELVLDGDMPVLLEEADIAIGAGGSNAFERACLGLPSIIFVVADNQCGIAALMAAAGGAIVVADTAGSLLDAFQALRDSSDLRIDMARKAARLIDGRGAGRLVDSVIRIAA
jgi:UDP-2,4-diacetamido-2,4,6-trideoxy-beta-L-altropyranose hydrolase